MASASSPVGVFALQGDVREHVAALASLGIATRPVRRPRDLDGLAGIVLPGGESSTMLKLLAIQGLEAPLGEFLRSGRPVLATCAGLILCASRVVEPEQRSYGVLDVTVARNGWGRQIASGTFALRTSTGSGLPDPMDAVFIRAPRIVAVGPRCEVLATRDGEPVLVRQGAVLGACFHPELEVDHPVTKLFAAMLPGGNRVLVAHG
ncbi:MAG: pyridoxal 5'-phosphate synthase glutaminase subunit PdxT [Planctomycetota bacterium]